MESERVDRDAFELEVHQLMGRRDRRFIELCYDKYSSSFYGIAIRIVNDQDLAKDVVQDSFVKIWKNCGKFDPEKARLFTWMYSIVRNTALDKIRSRKIRTEREIQTADSNVSLETSEKIQPDTIDIPRHVKNLDDKYREIVQVLFYQGLTQQEASEKLEIPLGTVKTRLRIALRELRKVYIDDR